MLAEVNGPFGAGCGLVEAGAEDAADDEPPHPGMRALAANIAEPSRRCRRVNMLMLELELMQNLDSSLLEMHSAGNDLPALVALVAGLCVQNGVIAQRGEVGVGRVRVDQGGIKILCPGLGVREQQDRF
jgi:hypothetical protein